MDAGVAVFKSWKIGKRVRSTTPGSPVTCLTFRPAAAATMTCVPYWCRTARYYPRKISVRSDGCHPLAPINCARKARRFTIGILWYPATRSLSTPQGYRSATKRSLRSISIQMILSTIRLVTASEAVIGPPYDYPIRWWHPFRLNLNGRPHLMQPS